MRFEVLSKDTTNDLFVPTSNFWFLMTAFIKCLQIHKQLYEGLDSYEF
jgi:hypothetical protein